MFIFKIDKLIKISRCLFSGLRQSSSNLTPMVTAASTRRSFASKITKPTTQPNKQLNNGKR